MGKLKTIRVSIIQFYLDMKKKKIIKLSLGKNTVSSFNSMNLKGGTGTYDCWTFARPCASFTEPPETIANCETTYCNGTTTGNESTNCATASACGCQPTIIICHPTYAC